MLLPIRTILAPTDFSEPSLQALDAAVELARHFGAELLIAYVIPPVPALPPDPNYSFEMPRYEEALRINAETRLKETASSRVPADVHCRTAVGYGEAAREIVRLTVEEQPDLLVIATHGHTGWRHLVFGSVTEKVVRLSPSPVLTIRVPGPGEE